MISIFYLGNKINFFYYECTLLYGCIGALDGIHINVHVRVKDKPRYRNLKGEIKTNMLGVCSQDLQFIYVLLG